MKKLTFKKVGLLLALTLAVSGFIACSANGATEEVSSVKIVEPVITEQPVEIKEEIKFTDLAGREVILEGPAERIFLGFYAESFIAVNGGLDNVVCISKAEWEDFFNGQYRAYVENMPQLDKIVDAGSVYKGSFSMEATLSINPDVAILAPFQFETLGENIEKLEKAGIKVVVLDYNAQKLDKHIASTEIIGKITGQNDRAKTLIDEYTEAYQDVEKRVANLTAEEKKRVYIELGNKGAEQIGNSYGDYMWGGLVVTAGGENIALGKVESYGALSPEYILSTDPEVIIFSGSSWINDTGNRVKVGFGVDRNETIERLKPFTERAGWSELTAVKNDDIYTVHHAGLRSIYDYTYLQYIGKSIYPELFEDINPEENLKKFYDTYLPVEATGSFMTKFEQ